MLPPINGGLHCGGDNNIRGAKAGTECSRRAAAGLRCGELMIVTGILLWPACSRCSAAGSIAVRSPPGSRPVRCRVLPPLTGWLHCGWTNLGKGQPETLVLPPCDGGLHCGRNRLMVRMSPERGAPAMRQRAPLRLAVHRRLPSAQCRAPAIKGGLDCGSSQYRFVASWNGILPPLIGGLHCGQVKHLQIVGAVTGVLPLFDSGLHCGRNRLMVRMSPERGAPAMRQRAPLRLLLRTRHRSDSHVCSRCSMAGSIAALSPRTAARPGHRAPAVQRRAPSR